MRRLARQLLTFCSALSLVLCLLCAAMRVRSELAQDSITWAREGGSLTAVQSSSGRLLVTRASGWPKDRNLQWARLARFSFDGEWAGWPAANLRVEHLPGVWVSRGSGWFGRGDYPASGGPLYPVTVLTVRWDALLLLFAVTPAALTARRILAARRKRLRTAAGRCPSCGYDLRASHERCPECGATTAKG